MLHMLSIGRRTLILTPLAITVLLGTGCGTSTTGPTTTTAATREADAVVVSSAIVWIADYNLKSAGYLAGKNGLPSMTVVKRSGEAVDRLVRLCRADPSATYRTASDGERTMRQVVADAAAEFTAIGAQADKMRDAATQGCR